jgi:hypothetical protein
MDDHLKWMKEGSDVPKNTVYISLNAPLYNGFDNGKLTRFLCENRILPFDINMLRNHVFAGAIVDIKLRFHELPLPDDLVSANFMNMKLRVHRSLCPRRA